MFGLINANARLYNPYLGRFVSPDPLLNSEGSAWDYNPYVYANNNPYKYIDRNGEIGFLAVALIGFAAGGAMNVACNWDDIHNVGDFCSYFGVGGAAGAIGAAAAVLAPAGVLPGVLYGALGGSLSGGILGGCNNLLKGLDFWSGASSGALYGAASGAIFGGLYGAARANAAGLKGASYWTGRERVNTIVNPPAANTSATPKNSGPKYVNKGEEIQWPKSGEEFVAGTKETVTLPEGTVIDRFSPSTNELMDGRWFSDPNVSYVNRSIPYKPTDVVYGKWKLIKPLYGVQKSIAAPIPHYGLPGGGVQFQVPIQKGIPLNIPGKYMNAQQMIQCGLIIPF